MQNAEKAGKATQSRAGAKAAQRAQAFASAATVGRVLAAIPMSTRQISPWRGVICCQGDLELPVPLGATAVRQPTLLLRAGE